MKESILTSPVTLRDIAMELRVGHSTVSRALQNASNISLERRKEIQEAAQKWDTAPMPWRPNWGIKGTLITNARSAPKLRGSTIGQIPKNSSRSRNLTYTGRGPAKERKKAGIDWNSSSATKAFPRPGLKKSC